MRRLITAKSFLMLALLLTVTVAAAIPDGQVAPKAPAPEPAWTSIEPANVVPTFPFFFPPIADCGTVGTVQSFFDLDGDGQLDDCPVWFADSGGAFLVSGIDAFNVGDRVHVRGLICTICLTTCPASAILNGVITVPCP